MYRVTLPCGCSAQVYSKGQVAQDTSRDAARCDKAQQLWAVWDAVKDGPAEGETREKWREWWTATLNAVAHHYEQHAGHYPPATRKQRVPMGGETR